MIKLYRNIIGNASLHTYANPLCNVLNFHRQKCFGKAKPHELHEHECFDKATSKELPVGNKALLPVIIAHSP